MVAAVARARTMGKRFTEEEWAIIQAHFWAEARHKGPMTPLLWRVAYAVMAGWFLIIVLAL